MALACLTPADCPQGYTCDNGICVLQTTTPPPTTPPPTTRPPISQNICMAGICIPKTVAIIGAAALLILFIKK